MSTTTQPTQKQIKARINRLFQKFYNLDQQHSDNEQAANNGDMKWSEMEKKNAKLDKRRYEALDTLEDYMKEHGVYNETIFVDMATAKTEEMFCNCCCTFDQLFGKYDQDELPAQDAEQDTPQEIDDSATFTATITTQDQSGAVSTQTTNLPQENFQDLTAEQITNAINQIMQEDGINHITITRWTSAGSSSIQFGEMPKLPEPPRPPMYGKEFSDGAGFGPTVIVGHPHPYTGIVVDWPVNVSEDYAEKCFIHLLNSTPMHDIQPLKKQIETLQEGDRIQFEWNNKLYKCEFKCVKHTWHGSMMNVRNISFLTGKKLRYQNNIALGKISEFKIL